MLKKLNFRKKSAVQPVIEKDVSSEVKAANEVSNVHLFYYKTSDCLPSL